jgi:cobalt-zinc-cadmium efflux system outer membrane protein
MKRVIIPLALYPLIGCTAISPQLGFEEIQHSFSDRSSHTLSWAANPEEAKALQEEVQQLLTAPLTHESAARIALLNNHLLQAEYQSLGIAQAELIAASRLSNPVLDADIRFLSHGTEIELGLIQNVLDLFKLPQRRKVGTSAFEEAKLRILDRCLALVAEVHSSYFEYQAAAQTLKLASTSVEASAASRELAERMHKAGNINDLQLAQAQAEHESLELERAEQEEVVVKSREKLNTLLGLESTQINWTAPDRLPEAPSETLDFANAEEKVMANSVALARARQSIATTAASLGLAENFSLLEELELGPTATKEGASRWGFGPVLSLPLPLFNQGQAEVFAQQSQLRQRMEEYKAVEQQVQASLRELQARYTLAAKKLKRLRERVLPIHERLLSEYQKHYNAIFVGGFELLEAKRRHIRAEQSYVSSLKNYWVARSALEALTRGSLPHGWDKE